MSPGNMLSLALPPPRRTRVVDTNVFPTYTLFPFLFFVLVLISMILLSVLLVCVSVCFLVVLGLRLEPRAC